MRTHTSWATLGRRARLWRLVHAVWSVTQLAGLGYIWACAASGRRSPRLWAFVALLLAEGAALAVGRGNCPMGRRQAAWGDPVPFFELILPPRAAKAAVPVLAVISAAAIGALVLRRPGVVARCGSCPRAPTNGRFGTVRSRAAPHTPQPNERHRGRASAAGVKPPLSGGPRHV